MAKKYASLETLRTFLDNLKETFSDSSHKHTISDITDYTVDTALSSTSSNPVQNKVIDAEFDAISEAMGALEQSIDGKADSEHEHSISDVTNLQSTLDGKVPTSRTVNGKALSGNITLSASDVSAYNKTEIDTKLSGKSDSNHNHDGKYDASGTAQIKANSALASAKSYTDTAISNLINSAPTTLDTLGEIATAMGENADVVEALETAVGTKANASDLTSHTGNKSNPHGVTKSQVGLGNVENKSSATIRGEITKSDVTTALGYTPYTPTEVDTKLSGKADSTHGHAISDVSGLQTALDGKADASHGTHVSFDSTNKPKMDGTAAFGTSSKVARADHVHPTDTSRASKTEFDTHVADTTKHITSTERTNWNAAKTHADSAHAPSNAQANQNAFSNIKVGTTTIAADTTTDTLELVGSNVTITPDATNDKVTISVADGSTSTKGVVQLTNSTSSTSTTTAATPSSVKSAYDLANTAKTNAATAQTRADSAYSLAESKVDSLSDLGITATATELNYMDGVTSNVQTQLDNKAGKSSATTSTAGLMSSTDKSKMNYTNIAYGTCSTAADVQEKVITVTGNTNWTMGVGSIIMIKFSNTNTANTPKFNVNGTGAKGVLYNKTMLTTNNKHFGGTKDRPMFYMYNGTNYVFLGWSWSDTNQTLGNGFGQCTTAASTVEKAVSLNGFYLTMHGFVSVEFKYDVPANATMNINGTGAVPIYYRDLPITTGVIKAGDLATFSYSGAYFHLIAIDRWQDDIGQISQKASVATMSTAEYNALETKNANTLYMLTDDEYNDRPDWNENNETSASYIQNRPFYTSKEVIYEYDGISLEGNVATGDAKAIRLGDPIPMEEMIGLYITYGMFDDSNVLIGSEERQITEDLFDFNNEDMFGISFGIMITLKDNVSFNNITYPTAGFYAVNGYYNLQFLSLHNYNIVKLDEKYLPNTIQKVTDNSLETEDKTIAGAINEINAKSDVLVVTANCDANGNITSLDKTFDEIGNAMSMQIPIFISVDKRGVPMYQYNSFDAYTGIFTFDYFNSTNKSMHLLHLSSDDGVNISSITTEEIKLYESNAMVLSSPNGTRFQITVGDDGVLTATEITA